MQRFSTSLAIEAGPQAVWSLLVDTAGYPAWNSTVARIDGRIEAGATLRVQAKIAAARAFPVRVAEFAPPRRMAWIGGMPLGLFAGVRIFTLEPIADGAVRFTMEETYGGLLAPLIARSIPDLQPAFDAFAADLKRRAEAAPARPRVEA
jgi:hypothetical protein